MCDGDDCRPLGLLFITCRAKRDAVNLRKIVLSRGFVTAIKESKLFTVSQKMSHFVIAHIFVKY